MSDRQKDLEQLARLVKRAMKSEGWEWAKSVEYDPFWDIERITDRLEATKPRREYHYLIISQFYGDPIGCTHSSAQSDVLSEEPGVTFKRIAKRKCPICNKRQK